MRSLLAGGLLLTLLVSGCGKDSPTQPASSSSLRSSTAATSATSNAAGRTAPGKPGYEPAYVNGHVVTINAIEVPNAAPGQAQADFYEVVYPPNWKDLGLAPPQCNPCDHTGDGIDPTDFHDHILDSEPAAPGHGEFSPLWHVSLVVPILTGDSGHDAAVSAAYAAHLPTRSESEVDALLATHLAGGAPIAVEIDTHFYFLCAVVSPMAAR